MQKGALLFLDAFQDRLRVGILRKDNPRVAHGVGKKPCDQAEDVEQRQDQADAVFVRDLKVFGIAQSGIEDVAGRKEHALGTPCGPGTEDHDRRIIRHHRIDILPLKGGALRKPLFERSAAADIIKLPDLGILPNDLRHGIIVKRLAVPAAEIVDVSEMECSTISSGLRFGFRSTAIPPSMWMAKNVKTQLY